MEPTGNKHDKLGKPWTHGHYHENQKQLKETDLNNK
jgi:hypothetical protein